MNPLQKRLTYAGTIPFWGLAGFIFLGVSELPLLGSTHHALTLYATVIAAFMMGSSWGSNLSQSSLHDDSSERKTALVANAQAILLWLGVIASDGGLRYLILATLFAWVLWLDRALFVNGKITADYWFHRKIVTAIVVVVLVVMSVYELSFTN
ncbi:DUF3429 domain-containing protein [Halioxenophilus aromaticivorans]|uniref:DUF3429 domain-containing protein n=1 Tax=Halioxenophilus aromaticivorans TaxID=1306992 RepID=A0AAV3U524_9ALTE